MKTLDDLLAFYQELPNWSGIKCAIDSRGLFGDYPLHIAATRCDVNEIEILLNAGGDLDARGENGYTPLMNAVEQGSLDCVKLFVESGADLKIICDEGLDALALASLHGEDQIAQFLNGIIAR